MSNDYEDTRILKKIIEYQGATWDESYNAIPFSLYASIYKLDLPDLLDTAMNVFLAYCGILEADSRLQEEWKDFAALIRSWSVGEDDHWASSLFGRLSVQTEALPADSPYYFASYGMSHINAVDIRTQVSFDNTTLTADDIAQLNEYFLHVVIALKAAPYTSNTPYVTESGEGVTTYEWLKIMEIFDHMRLHTRHMLTTRE